MGLKPHLNQVSIYGSLRPGASNFSLVASYVRELHRAYIQGALYHLPVGYPTVIYGTGGKVQGELLRLEPLTEALALLDAYEVFSGSGASGNEYERIRGLARRETGQTYAADMYVCPPAEINGCKAAGILIPDGDWKTFCQQRASRR